MGCFNRSPEVKAAKSYIYVHQGREQRKQPQQHLFKKTKKGISELLFQHNALLPHDRKYIYIHSYLLCIQSKGVENIDLIVRSLLKSMTLN
jgi:hypothetical protein